MTDRIIVIHSDGTKENFKPRMISQTIMDETGVDEELAARIQDRIAKKLYKLKQNEGLTELSTSDLRAEVSSQLLKEGEFKAVEQNRKLGMSVSEFEDLLTNGCKDNANIGYSPEMIAKYAYDSIAKEYSLSKMPEHCAKAHIDGYIHLHDLEYFELRPNCMNYDLRFFAKNGLVVDGIGLMGSAAKPAKSLEVLLNHLLQAWMAGATVFSGGQGYTNFNTMLAPFARGRTYKDIKQAIQGFIFNCNMSLICRGGQVLFTSIGVDLSVPEVLANEPAIGPNGIANGVYKDYQEEADLIFRAILEVSEEKDGMGAYHRFPNILFNIRDGDLDKYEGNCKLLHEKGANNPTLYYVNCKTIERTVMGCRTALPMNWTGNYETDCLNTGNFAYTTLNLPLIALDANKDINKFYELLNKICEIAYDALIYRRKQVIDAIYKKRMSNFLLQEDKETQKPLYDIDNTTITLGFCGLYECLLALDNPNEGEDIIKFLNQKKEEFNYRDKLRWSVIASPAESTAHRFAEIIKEKYPQAQVQGVKGSYYLTNSNHIPVSNDTNIIDHIKNAKLYNPLTLGGSILHLWSGEVWSDAKAIWSLNKKIIDANVTFWAYSKVFTFCQECQFTINDNIDVCPICGSKQLVTYDRCFSGDTIIYIKKDDIIKPIEIKDFVENYNVKDWQVPVFDYERQEYVWSYVKRGIKNPLDNMITLKFNKGYSITCTPNHNFYDYKTINRKSSMYKTISASDLKIKSRIINHRCPNFIDNLNEENYLGTFIGFVLGDGNVTLQKNGQNVFIRLKFYKKEKSDYCKFILDKNDLVYTYTDDIFDSRYGTRIYSYYIGVDNIGNEAYDIFNKTNGDKRKIIDFCYHKDLLIGVFAGLINSDGSVLCESRKNSIITTFNQVDRDILWLFYNISLLLGVNPSISFTKRDDYRSLGRVEITSQKGYEILQNIKLRSPFNINLQNGKCISDAKRINGMCSVSEIIEAPKQNSYCIEVEHDAHNTVFNGILAENCTGYYLPTKGFNNGKQQEFKERYRHKI